jgi:zinc-finger of the FCS-type, C2-C2
MKRTTSMSEFYLDEVLADVDETHQLENPNHHTAEAHPAWMRYMGPASSMLSPCGTTHRRNSADYTTQETASFLKACGLCQRRLAPGRDIFMYR